eukprot:COSAG02_NODE_433_length_22435_cov_151.224078_17_plen_177_part_00
MTDTIAVAAVGAKGVRRYPVWRAHAIRAGDDSLERKQRPHDRLGAAAENRHVRATAAPRGPKAQSRLDARGGLSREEFAAQEAKKKVVVGQRKRKASGSDENGSGGDASQLATKLLASHRCGDAQVHLVIAQGSVCDFKPKHTSSAHTAVVNAANTGGLTVRISACHRFSNSEIMQ